MMKNFSDFIKFVAILWIIKGKKFTCKIYAKIDLKVSI